MTNDIKHFFLLLLYILVFSLYQIIKQLCLLARIYKSICLTRIILIWFPAINPYTWPCYFFEKFTFKYFKFCKKLVATIIKPTKAFYNPVSYIALSLVGIISKILVISLSIFEIILNEINKELLNKI